MVEIKEGKDKKVVFAFHTKRIEPILDELIDFLKIEEQTKIDELKQKFEETIEHYLEEMCH